MTVFPDRNKTFSLSEFLVSDGPAGFVLSWVAGFVDTSAFIILFGIFTAHVTGNIALAGAAFVDEDFRSVAARLLMLPTFVIAVALTSILARYVRRRQGPVFAILLTVEAIALIVFWVLGVILSPYLLLDVQDEYILPIAIAGVIAMAVQNALMKEAHGTFKSYIPTTVMTGNTTQLTIDVVQFLSAKLAPATTQVTPAEAEQALERMSRFIPVILGFALGGGAAAYFILLSESWWTLAFPVVLITVLAIAAYVQHYRPTSVME